MLRELAIESILMDQGGLSLRRVPCANLPSDLPGTHGSPAGDGESLSINVIIIGTQGFPDFDFAILFSDCS